MSLSSISNKRQAVELKGSVLTVAVAHLHTNQAALLYGELEEKISQAASFFLHAPILIDVSGMSAEEQNELDFSSLAEIFRRHSMIPLGVRGACTDQVERILKAGLAIMPKIKNEKSTTLLSDQQIEAQQQGQHTLRCAPPKLITSPVRSGQQVVAPDGDLIVLAAVNGGAEIWASGNIHVYGALRGRAMAGMNGDVSARIFCLHCNPELVGVAGEYLVNDDLDASQLNHSMIISLEQGGLKFKVLGDFNSSI